MKKPKILTEEVKIEKIIPGGQALGTLLSGQKIMLWNALPGEIISEIEITKRKTHYLEGIATKIKQPSDKRILPKDDCFLSTSPWQILEYPYELTLKVDIIKELLVQNQLLGIPVKNIVTDHKDFYYRNKMEYSLFFDHDSRKIHLSFHIRGTHCKIPISSSSIEMPEIYQRATEIISELNSSGRRASDFQSLILRSDQRGKVSGGLLENHKPHPTFETLEDTLLSKTFSYSPNGFFQINLPVYELALKYIKNHITTQTVLDLYSGVGSIGLSVASDKELTLVEVNQSAYQEMLKNCESIKQQIKNNKISPVLAKSEEALDFIKDGITVILDPPRAGCDSKLLEKCLNTNLYKIIYMSCNSATLARDLKILSSKYQAVEITPFNFFPRTPHIETVAILQPK